MVTLFVRRIVCRPFILAVVPSYRRGPGRPVVAGVLDVVHHVLELDGHVEVERRLDAARHDLSPGRLGRAADLDRELEGLAVLGPADADRGQTGLVDLGTGPAVADQVDDRVAFVT